MLLLGLKILFGRWEMICSQQRRNCTKNILPKTPFVLSAEGNGRCVPYSLEMSLFHGSVARVWKENS